jgi:hypothetical protein
VNLVARPSRSRSIARGGCGAAGSQSGLGSLADARFAAQATGEHRRRHRLEMRLASHRGVERFEAPGGIEQQDRSAAAASAGERDLRAQALRPRALKLVEWGKLGGRQQLERRVRCRGTDLGLCGSQGPPAPLRRIGRQLGRVRQERGGSRRAPTGLRPVGRALQLGGHLLVDTHRRASTMPRPTIGIGIRIDRLRQCSGRPAKSRPVFGSRTATTIATDSASSRRATKPRISPETSSSH